LISATIYLYFRTSQHLDNSGIPVLFLFIGMIGVAAVGCLLGTALYGVAADPQRKNPFVSGKSTPEL
jgi:hypothetical protein